MESRELMKIMKKKQKLYKVEEIIGIDKKQNFIEMRLEGYKVHDARVKLYYKKHKIYRDIAFTFGNEAHYIEELGYAFVSTLDRRDEIMMTEELENHKNDILKQIDEILINDAEHKLWWIMQKEDEKID